MLTWCMKSYPISCYHPAGILHFDPRDLPRMFVQGSSPEGKADKHCKLIVRLDHINILLMAACQGLTLAKTGLH